MQRQQESSEESSTGHGSEHKKSTSNTPDSPTITQDTQHECQLPNSPDSTTVEQKAESARQERSHEALSDLGLGQVQKVNV